MLAPAAVLSPAVPTAVRRPDRSPFGLTFDARGPLREAAFAFEAQTFGTTYGVAYPDHVAEFAPYEDASLFVVVQDRADEVCAAMRLIVPGPAGLKTLVEAGGEPWRIDGMRAARAAGVDPARTWDVASLGVARGVGRHRPVVTASLYHALAVAAPLHGVRSLLMTVDERVRSILQMMGLITTALPGAHPGPFCGSPASTTVYGHCTAMFAEQRRVNPEAYRLISLGLGLDPVALPPRSAFLPAGTPARRARPAPHRPVSGTMPLALVSDAAIA